MTFLAAALWVAAFVLLALISSAVVTSLLAFIGLIVIPGAALSLALIPVGRSGVATRVAGSIAFGIALAIFAAIVLDQTPIGLRWTPGLLAIVAVVSLAILAGVGRAAGPIRVPPIVASANSRQLALLGLSVLLAVGSFGIARIGVSSMTPSDVTQLWMLPNTDGSVELGIANHADATQDYGLVLNLDGRDVQTWPAIRLQPGEVWKGAPDAVPASGRLKASLYRADLPGPPFREVFLSLPAAGG
ncbi:MAG: hypothetical protein ABI555_02120 [Chloroflexota bacterium]